MNYNWQLKNWPNFIYNASEFEELAVKFYTNSGKSVGIFSHLNAKDKKESILQTLIEEAMKTSAIEGEMISRMDVMSSIKKKLGYIAASKSIKDKRSIGIAEAILISRERFEEPLTEKMIFEWHSAIFSHTKTIIVGQWRRNKMPMQIISGNYGKEIIHFEAPPSSKVSKEMKRFISWYNQSKSEIKNPIIRSAIAHIYFESIHPFEDGNGRIGRILSEKLLSQAIEQPILLSLSHSIESKRKTYYEELKINQRKLDIHSWILFFGGIIIDAQKRLTNTIEFTIKKTKFMDQVKTMIDSKQMKVLEKMLTEEEFKGGMNASKYISITSVSKATATRDLANLAAKNIIKIVGGGRSTAYKVNWSLV